MLKQTTDASKDVLSRKMIFNSQLANFPDPDPDPEPDESNGGGSEDPTGPGTGS